jgi:ABC-type lipoprotein export system ATPase subunit
MNNIIIIYYYLHNHSLLKLIPPIFLYYNTFQILNIIFSSIILKYIYKYFLEIPIKQKILNNLLNSFEKMPITWIEQNNQYMKELINNTQTNIYNKYHSLCELYTSIFNVYNCIKILYYIYNPSIYYSSIYLIFYLIFYLKIILYTRENTKKDNKIIFDNKIQFSNILNIYYNSKIGKYESLFKRKLNQIFTINENINIKILNRELLYSSSLNIFQKILLIILLYNYLTTNCNIKCSIYFLPLYQTTITFIYQFEYILHNIQSYNTNSLRLVNYNDFKKLYKKYISIKPIQLNITQNKNFINFILKDIYVDFFNNDSRKNLLITKNIFLDLKKPLLIQGSTGIGKTTICKLISGYFPNYNNYLANNILYIPQNTLLYYTNRSLTNIITNNDIFNTNANYSLIDNIVNIIPFNDIIYSFDYNWKSSIIQHNTFSGGQERRIYLAMWLYHLFTNINKYKIIIFDELEN